MRVYAFIYIDLDTPQNPSSNPLHQFVEGLATGLQKQLEKPEEGPAKTHNGYTQ